MNPIPRLILPLLFAATSAGAMAQPEIEMDTTVIKGNKELPKILFIVPWQDMKQSKDQQHTLVLHSLFGDMFEPVMPPGGMGTTPEHEK